MNKTPEEIKKGLECCIPRNYESTCRKCPYSRDDSSAKCIADLENDAIAYIQQLESRLAQVERERDALMYYAKGCCTTCAFRDDCAKHDLNDSSPYGARWYYGDCEDWEWLGPCPENTKEETK